MQDFELKLRKIRTNQLRLSNRVSAGLWAFTLGLENRLRMPDRLTDTAVQRIARLNLIHVTQAEERFFDVFANHGVANLLLNRKPNSRIQVLVWPKKEAFSPTEAMFLNFLMFGLPSGQQNSVLRLFGSLTREERERISPELASRAGLERLTGVSRKIAMEDPNRPIVKTDQIAMEL